MPISWPLPQAFGFGWVGGRLSDDTNAGRVRQKGGWREPDEQAVLDHAGNAGEPIGERRRIGDPPQRGIENPMTAIGDEREAVLALAQLRRPRATGGGSGGFDRPPGGSQAERPPPRPQPETPQR